MASLHRTLTRGEPYANEYRIHLPGGGVRWIRSVAHRLPDDHRRMFGVSMDVTERRAADDRLRQATDQLRADVQATTRFNDLCNRLAGVSGLEPLLEEVLDAAIELHGADGGSVWLHDGETENLRVVARRGHQPGSVDPTDPEGGVVAPVGAVTWSQALLDGAGALIGALTTHTRRPARRSELEVALTDVYLRQAFALVAAMATADPAPHPGSGD